MTLQHFKTLSKFRQYKAIQQSGVYLCTRRKPSIKSELYQIDGFYLEVFYHPRTDAVTWMRLFDHTDALEPYLASINVPEFN